MKILFWANNFSPHVLVDIIRVFFIPEFVAKSLKANKNQPIISPILQYSFTQKTTLILRISTLLKLKIKCSQNTLSQKNTFSVYKFSSKHFSVWCKKKHLHCTISWRPRTTFLKYFESKCLYISVYLSKKSLVSKTWQDFIWWYGEVGGGGCWIISLRWLVVWLS